MNHLAQWGGDFQTGDVAHIRGIEKVVENTLSVILYFAGVVLFIMLLVGGFKYITSGNNPESLQSAKNTLTYAIVGIIVIASAFLIINFIELFTGAKVTLFQVYVP